MSSTVLELHGWACDVAKAIAGLREAVERKQPARPLSLPILPACATTDAVCELLDYLARTAWPSQKEAVAWLRAGDDGCTHFFLCGDDAEERFKERFGALAPAIRASLSDEGSLWSYLAALPGLRGFIHADLYVPRLLHAILEHSPCSKDETIACIILWERVVFGARSGSHPPPGGHEVQRAVAELFACAGVLGLYEYPFPAFDMTAAWAFYWGAVIVPSRVGDYETDRLDCILSVEHLVAEGSWEDFPNDFVLHERDGACACKEDGNTARLCIKEDELCFDRAIAALQKE